MQCVKLFWLCLFYADSWCMALVADKMQEYKKKLNETMSMWWANNNDKRGDWIVKTTNKVQARQRHIPKINHENISRVGKLSFD